MSVTLIPESAPFNQEQRAWLNGFFAGVLGIEEGSNNGNGTALLNGSATENKNDVSVEAEEEDDFPWHDPGLEIDERMELAAGKPTKHRLMAAMAQLDCGSCGYVCQTYAEAIASGEDASLTKCVPGAKKTSRMLKKILSEDGAETNGKPVAAVSSTPTNGKVVKGCSRDNPFSAKLIVSAKLNGEGSAKDTRHVEIDLAGSNLKYNVGDSLGVFPFNCPELVQAIIGKVCAEPETKVESILGDEVTLSQALEQERCLKEVTDELLDLLKSAAIDSAVVEQLTVLADAEELDDMDVLDVLEEFPTMTLDPKAFVATLSPLQPRLYSIASSQKQFPDAVHLTVGRTTSDYRNRLRKGVCSTMFSDRLTPGQNVKVFVQPSHGFSVPAKDDSPLIMVGPGTGIAPFMAFLQERKARNATGKNWLFFGDQKQSCDFLYEKDLLEMKSSGLLTRLDLAFSREQEEKIYVQNRMLEHAAELYTWLEEGASFCVCGDAKRMAGDVDRALHQIVESHGGVSAEDAKAYVKKMVKDQRYLRDVY